MSVSLLPHYFKEQFKNAHAKSESELTPAQSALKAKIDAEQARVDELRAQQNHDLTISQCFESFAVHYHSLLSFLLENLNYYAFSGIHSPKEAIEPFQNISDAGLHFIQPAECHPLYKFGSHLFEGAKGMISSIYGMPDDEEELSNEAPSPVH